MIGWWPCPSGLACDPRWASLPLAARGLLASLLDAADGSGEVPVGMLDGVEAAVALSGQEESETVADALKELVRVGLVVEVGDVLTIHLRSVQAPEARRAAPPPESASDTDADGDGQGDAAAVERRRASRLLGSRWSNKKLKSASARAAWLASEQGQAYLVSHEIDPELARDLAGLAGQRRGLFGQDRDGATRGESTVPRSATRGETAATRGENLATSGATLGSPSDSPSERKTAETEGEGVRTRGATSVATRGETAATHGATRGESTVPRSATPKTQNPPPPPGSTSSPEADPEGPSVDELLYQLEQRSEGGFGMSGSVDQREAVVHALIASGLNLDTVADALKDPTAIWPRWERVQQQRTVTVAMLAGKKGPDGTFPCEGVTELVAWVKTHQRPAKRPWYPGMPSPEEEEARVKGDREAIAAAAAERKAMEERGETFPKTLAEWNAREAVKKVAEGMKSDGEVPSA